MGCGSQLLIEVNQEAKKLSAATPSLVTNVLIRSVYKIVDMNSFCVDTSFPNLNWDFVLYLEEKRT